MIQRKQTLFILGSLVCTFFLLFLINLVDSEKCNIVLNSSSESQLNIFFFGSFILGFISIFLFKNRLFQYRLSLINMYFQLCPLVYICSYINLNSCVPEYSEVLGLYFIYASLAFYGLAAIYIKKDNDLIKNSDRI